jgi:hypothetical protein
MNCRLLDMNLKSIFQFCQRQLTKKQFVRDIKYRSREHVQILLDAIWICCLFNEKQIHIIYHSGGLAVETYIYIGKKRRERPMIQVESQRIYL